MYRTMPDGVYRSLLLTKLVSRVYPSLPVPSRRCSYIKLSPRLKVGLILETLISWDDTTSRVGRSGGLDTSEAAS